MKLSAREITTTTLFTALIIVGAFIKIDIPLPLYTMHFTLQWFFVLMAGFILGHKRGVLSVVVYIAIGLVGVPVFAAGGGPYYILRPGFGFLAGFVLAVFLIGFLTEKSKANTFPKMMIFALVGLVAYYIVGAIYFYLIKNIYVKEAVSFGVVIVEYCLITVIPDLVLCIIAAALAVKLKPIFTKIMMN